MNGLKEERKFQWKSSLSQHTFIEVLMCVKLCSRHSEGHRNEYKSVQFPGVQGHGLDMSAMEKSLI